MQIKIQHTISDRLLGAEALKIWRNQQIRGDHAQADLSQGMGSTKGAAVSAG
jgi:hypothetical protein